MAGLVVLPALAMAGLVPEAAPAWVALALAAVFASLIDALLGWPRIAALDASAPPVLRVAKNRAARLRVRLLHPARRPPALRMALALPDSIHAEPAEHVLALPNAPASLVDWNLTPSARGRFPVPFLHLEASSPAGLWAWRRSIPLRSEVRAQPALGAALRANAAFLSKALSGQRLVRNVGKGREFEKLRDYVAGDPVDDIHWRATAKRGHPVTKVFQVERTQEVYVVLDHSRLSGRVLAPPEPLLEHFIEAALLLGAVAERHGDLFGLATFDSRVTGIVRADNGHAHFNACRERLVTLQHRAVTPDFDELAAFLRTRLRRRALLLFLVNLDDPVASESFLRAIEVLRRQHLCVVVQPHAPDVEPLFSHGHVHNLDDIQRAMAGHLQWHGLRQLASVLHARGVPMASAPPESLASVLVTRYLDAKRRQAI
jgi:uncharacterized protein (DUF58 family)